MNFDNIFVLVFFSFACSFFFFLNKHNVMKSFMIKLYTPHLKNLYTFRNAKNYITVAKTCEKILRLDMTSTTKVKVEYIHS